MAAINVIVPVYKVEPYLCRCIDSILAQTFSDFELILVDDGSPDGCGAICDEYAVRDPRVCVFHHLNRGQASARNNALDFCFLIENRQWITFIDSDDWVHREYLATLYCAAKSREVKMSQCSFLETEKYIASAVQNEITRESRTASPYAALYRPGRVEIDGYACGKLYAADLMRPYRFQPGMIFEDLYLIPEIVLQAGRIALCQDPLYFYFQRPDSTIWSKSEKKVLDKWKAYEKLIPLLKDHGENELARLMCRAYLFWTQSLTENTWDAAFLKVIRKRGRRLAWRFREDSGFPFRPNFDVLLAFYPFVGKTYRIFHKIVYRKKKQ